MKTCYDANVLLEVLLKGRQNAQLAVSVLSQTDQATISPLSAHLYVYFGRKEQHSVADLLEDLQAYEIAAMDARTLKWASQNRQDDDFEDAMQIGCAVLDGCDRFVTFDAQLAKNYSRFIDIQLLG